MIDDLHQTGLLLEALRECLPFEARVSPPLALTIQKDLPSFRPWQRCQVGKLQYLGDEGGIVCHLDIPDLGNKVFLTSITHLQVDPPMPYAREIASYQKRRIKRLRRSEAGTGVGSTEP